MAGTNHTSLKVLITADTVGGVWTYCLELCRSLREVEFHLVTTGARMQAGQKREIDTLPNVSVYETDYRLEWMDNPWDDIDASGEWLLRLEEELQPDIIHLNSFSYGSLPFQAPKIVVAHSDVCSWWRAVKGEMPPPEWREYYQRVQAGLQEADLVLAPSKAKLESIRDIYGVSTRSKAVYNGRNKVLFYKGEKQPFVLSMGRVWDEAKNIGLLLQAAPHTSCEIRIAGDQQFEKNSLTSDATNTRFLGKLDAKEVAQQLSTASLFVLPARYEPFGLSPLEAAYSGCALVLGDIPTFREIWDDAAVYVDPNDTLALATAITMLMQDKATLEAYAQKAEARAQLFSAEAMASAYRELYQQLQPATTKYVNQETL